MPISHFMGNELLMQRKLGNWWDPDNEGLCIYQAQQPKGAVSFAASLLDISGTGNNAGDPGGVATPPWDAVNGWKFDGIADYLTTTFVPQNDQSQTVIVQFTNVTNLGYLCGVSVGGGRRLTIRPDSGGGTGVRYENGGAVLVVPALLAGNLALAGDRGYRNGVAEGAAMAAWGAPIVLTLTIGARSGAIWGAVYVQAFAIYDCTLTAPQLLSIANAMALL